MNLPQSKFQEPTTSKSLKGFKLWRTSNLTFSKTSLKLHTKKQWLGLSLRIIEYPTNEYKTFSYTFRIDQIPFTYGERKKEQLNFPRICSQNLLISAAFTTILKMKPTQCNAIRVHTALASEPSRDKCPLETLFMKSLVSKEIEWDKYGRMCWNHIFSLLHLHETKQAKSWQSPSFLNSKDELVKMRSVDTNFCLVFNC